LINMNKKGQIAIEILVVLSILVIGGIFVGVYYIQGIGQNQQKGATTNSTLDSLVDNFTDPFDIPDNTDVPLNKVAAPVAIPSEGFYPYGTLITLISHTDDAIIRYKLNSADVNESSPIFPNNFYLTEDVQISAVAYKTGMEPSSKVKFTYTVNTVIAAFFTDIQVDETALPTGVVAGAPFTLKVVAEATVPSVRLSEVRISQNDVPTSACKFLGVGAVGKDITCTNGSCTDLGYLTNPEVAGTSYYNNFKFSCSEPGSYSFIFTGVLKTEDKEYSHMTSSQSIVIAPPTPNTIVAEIISPQDGLYYKDKPLILSSNIIGAEKEDVFCNWYATSKESQASLFLSDNCDALYDLSNSADFEVDKTYEINLFVSSRYEDISVAANPKVITIVDFENSDYLFFKPGSGQEMNQTFEMYFYTSRIADFEQGGYFDVHDSDNHCNFELTRAAPEQHEFVDPVTSEITYYYSYTFNSICNAPGTKTITVEFFQPDLPEGKGEVLPVSSVTTTYLIYDVVPFVDVEFGIYFNTGPALPSMTEVFDEALIVKGKESYSDEFYFAAPYPPNPTAFVDIYQGQEFYIYPSIISNPPQYLDGQGICTVKFTPMASNPEGKLQIYQQPCNQYKGYQITKLIGEYNAQLSVTGPNGMSFSKSKLVRFNTNPIYFINDNVYPIYYKDNSFQIELAISNLNNLSLTVTNDIYKTTDTSTAVSYISAITGTLRFSGVFDPMEGYVLINSSTFACNSSNSICTNNYQFSESGNYRVKITATTPYGNQVIKWVNFKIVEEPDGAEISYVISKTPTNVGLTGLLYRTVGANTYYKIGDFCVWNIAGQIIRGSCNITHNFSTFGPKNVSVIVSEQSGTPIAQDATAIINIVSPPPINSKIIADNPNLSLVVGESREFFAGFEYPIGGGEIKFIQATSCADYWYVEGVPFYNYGSCHFDHEFNVPGIFEISAMINNPDGTQTEVLTYVTVSESQILDPVSYGAQCTLYYDPGNPGNPSDACKIYQIDFQGGARLNTHATHFRYNFVLRNSNNQPIHQTVGVYNPSKLANVISEYDYKKIDLDYIDLVVPLSTSINTGGNLPYTFWIENNNNQNDYTEQSGVIQCSVIPGCP